MFQFLKTPISSRQLLLGTGAALAILSIVFRIAIFWNDFGTLNWFAAISMIIRASHQDLLFVVAITLLSIGIHSVLKGAQSQKWFGRIFVCLCSALLLIGLSNIIAVDILGEPVTLSWLSYSDIFNSTYMFESLLLMVNARAVFLTVLTIVFFGLITLTISLALPGRKSRGTSFVYSSVVAAVLSLGLWGANASPALDVGKTSNPIIAFGGSIFAAKRVSADFAATANAASKINRPPIASIGGARPVTTTAGQIENVVFFVLESTAARFVDSYGGAFGVTPNLSNYSAGGRTFTTAYAHAPASNFSLVSILSGIVPELSRYSMTYSYPELELQTVPSVLLGEGFRTGFFSSSDNRFQDTAGFAKRSGFEVIKDQFDWNCDRSVYATVGVSDEFTDTADDRCTIPPLIDWIEEQPEKPFFATVWTAMAHYPYYSGENPQRYVEDEDTNNYLNALRVGDEAFGDLMGYLEQTDRLNSTLVVVVGDHGEAFGEHGDYIHARAIFEVNLRVPLVFINPTLFDGETSEVIAGISDIAPTVLDLMDIEAPPSWQGLSLFAEERPNGALFFTPWNGFQVGYREGNKKFIYNANTEESWLFDLAIDPTEQNNLSATNQAEVDTAKTTLSTWVQLQNTWSDSLINGTFERPRSGRTKSDASEVVVYATGTSYLTPPRGEVRIDGEVIGQFDVDLAPSNAEGEASEYAINSILTAFQLPFEPRACAKTLGVFFLNDEWEGEGGTGDTDLMIQSLEVGGRRFWPYDFRSLEDSAGGLSNYYFRFWRNGGFEIDLEVSANCLSDNLVTPSTSE